MTDETRSAGKPNLQVGNKRAWKQRENMVTVLVVCYPF